MEHLESSGIIITVVSIALVINTVLLLLLMLHFRRMRSKFLMRWEELAQQLGALHRWSSISAEDKSAPFESTQPDKGPVAAASQLPAVPPSLALSEMLKPLADPSVSREIKAATLEQAREVIDTLEQEINSGAIAPSEGSGASELSELEEARAEDSGQQSDVWITQLEEVIIAHLGHPQLSTELLSEEMGISRRQLLRKVKKETGLSTSTFLRQLQMKQSYALIQSGEYETVKEVARAVGFSDAGYFSTLFKAEFGVSPSVVIQENQSSG
ncbi:MAG: helix-turn-helix domain-containing protein [Phaeodactylibacter xiamenensis]|uniref:HTH araC/xylS-type domain-containing protein n=1 Tax=Phaeodactylibacter xiamenensis TaxID=1524460 RepID=A0A098SD10_9BACT|nr:AraC family transcriptional regulator [Phaeodactylibacter xiamenensis]KGE88877.1 hypothetical protein IX84_06105 [Phaeodactylibacter xiamenensis]MCR9051942.1 AraC family transcriptional regulator [bacterium]